MKLERPTRQFSVFECVDVMLIFLILTLNRHADDHVGLWPSRGAGQYTDEKPQTVRDPTSLSTQC